MKQCASKDSAPSRTCQFACCKYLIVWYANCVFFDIEIRWEQHFSTACLITTLESASFSTSDVTSWEWYFLRFILTPFCNNLAIAEVKTREILSYLLFWSPSVRSWSLYLGWIGGRSPGIELHKAGNQRAARLLRLGSACCRLLQLHWIFLSTSYSRLNLRAELRSEIRKQAHFVL